MRVPSSTKTLDSMLLLILKNKSKWDERLLIDWLVGGFEFMNYDFEVPSSNLIINSWTGGLLGTLASDLESEYPSGLALPYVDKMPSVADLRDLNAYAHKRWATLMIEYPMHEHLRIKSYKL